MGKEYKKRVETNSVKGWTRDIPLYEDFEEITRWAQSGNGTETITRETTLPFSGSGNIKLLTDAGNADTAVITRYIGPAEPGLHKIVIFNRVPAAQSTNFEITYTFKLNDSEAGVQHIAEFKWIFGASWPPTFEVMDADWNQQEISGLDSPSFSGNWGPLIVTVNTRTGNWVKVQTSGAIVDISDIAMPEVAVASAQNPIAEIGIETTEAVAKSVEIDRIIVEPALE